MTAATLAPEKIQPPGQAYVPIHTEIARAIGSLLTGANVRHMPVIERQRRAIYVARKLAATAPYINTPHANDLGLIAAVAAAHRIPHAEINEEQDSRVWHPRLAASIGQFRRTVGNSALRALDTLGRNINELTPDAYDADRRRIFKEIAEQEDLSVEQTGMITREGFPIVVVNGHELVGRELIVELQPNPAGYETLLAASPYTNLDFPKR